MNTPRIMKNLKRALPVAMAVVLGSTAAPLVVKADSSKVVTPVSYTHLTLPTKLEV